MSKESTLITLGVLIAISPFVGLPGSWLSVILPVLGVATLLVGFFILREVRAQPPQAASPLAPTPEQTQQTPSAIA